MKAPPAACVVDASAAAPLFLPEPLSAQASRLFSTEGAAHPCQRVVPDLFYAECGNVLWKASRRLHLPDAMVRGFMDDLMAMDLINIPLAAVAGDALALSLAHDISVYDGCYLVAARALGIPLVTADERLIRKLPKRVGELVWLGDLAL